MGSGLVDLAICDRRWCVGFLRCSRIPLFCGAAMTFREDIIALDGFACRNPQCLSVKGNDSFAQGWLIVHHIRYKSHQGPDTKENTITLCKRCEHAIHHGHGRGKNRLSARQYMLKILNGLVGAPDYRWGIVHEEYRKRYGEAA